MHDESEALPPLLPEPAIAEIRLERVMGALAEPLRMTIARKLLLESDEFDHPCGWFGFDRPKSSLTHHFKALREAGVIHQRQYGLERRSRLRTEDLNERFPGLLDLIAATGDQ
ncbi:ArsR/SmtB family transcription factor [Nocardia cyriacigeorgica]|uniref:ArsR/SmtB family transcription factor n=1 Tax=Nocardia cyriacigeorgica TaxID=135487 RepID=UPI001894F6BA|nr:helix-turn-helix domain-containing protein [Nocardia cyriacigeorgica]MBF6414598.1 helix-turn-helix transcriptional regulator [Nocardia cyriacigeorgica]